MEKIAAGFVAVGVAASFTCIVIGCPWAALTCALSAGYIAWTAGDDEEE
jgi:hypothetical protein